MSSNSLCILHTNFHRSWGGQPSRILMLSTGMARRGHRLVIAAPQGSMLATRAREAGLEVFEEVAFRKSKYLMSAFRDARLLSRLLESRPFDIIDAHGSQDLWACAVAKKLGRHRVPLLFTRHNTKRVPDHVFNRYLYRRHVEHLIVVSASVLKRYESFLRRGDLEMERVSIVHSSYWQDRFHPDVNGTSVRRELLGEEGERLLLVGFIGRLVPDKGGTYFLKAAARVLRELTQVRFVLAGRGTEEDRLKREAADLGIADRVRFLGFREDIPQLTAALDLSVLPSVDCDASSAVLKEAMALGKAVVATAIGGADEIIRDGETGMLVPPRNADALGGAILSILRDPQRRREMGCRGRDRVEREFGQDRLVEGTLEAYGRVMRRHETADSGAGAT